MSKVPSFVLCAGYCMWCNSMLCTEDSPIAVEVKCPLYCHRVLQLSRWEVGQFLLADGLSSVATQDAVGPDGKGALVGRAPAQE